MADKSNITFDATPKQAKMLTELADVDEVLWGGQAGGGKSEGLLLFSLLRRMQNPKSFGLMLRRTFRELDKSLIRKAKFGVWPKFAKWNEEKKLFVFPNGSLQEFGYLETDNDLLQYQSAEYDDICFDELTHFPENHYHYMKSRLRPRTCKKGLVRSATNPGNLGHMWVKAYFVDMARENIYQYFDEDTKRYKTRYFIPASLEDNTLMSEEQRGEYRSWLNQLPEAERKQLRDGDWDYIPGAAFPELTREKHGCEDLPVPKWANILCSYDFGFGKPFSISWWWIDYDGRMWRFMEWYGWNGKPDQGLRLPVSIVAEGILEREKNAGLENRVYRIANPDIFSKTPNVRGGGQGPSVAEIMSEHGVIWNAGDPDRLLGKQQFHERLRVPEEGLPMAMFYNSGIHFWRTVPTLPLDETMEDVEQDKSEDHVYHDCRVAFMARPIIPEKPKPNENMMEKIVKKVKGLTKVDEYGINEEIFNY